MIYLKKAKSITKIGIFVATTLVVLIASYPYVVKASQETQSEDTSIVANESKKTKKGKKNKVKFENLTN